MKKIAVDTALLSVLAMIMILYFAVEFAKLRAKYNWFYSWYRDYLANSPAGTPVNIGPTRAALAYERPWLSNLVCSRPITQSAAEFLMRLVRMNIPAQYLLSPPSAGLTASPADAITMLNNFTVNEASWVSKNNPLSTTGVVPYDSALVQGYVAQVHSGTATTPPNMAGDLSLQILWLYGYEEFIRERFSWSATSVLSEWNYMFGVDVISPTTTPPDDDCSAGSFISSAMSMGMAGAGVGTGIGAAAGGIGALPGAGIGFLAGAVSSIFTKTQCL
jgi:hypothetical protein